LVQVTPLAKKKNVTSGSVKLPTLPETVAESCAPPPSGRLPVSPTPPLSLFTCVAIVTVTLPTVNGSQWLVVRCALSFLATTAMKLYVPAASAVCDVEVWATPPASRISVFFPYTTLFRSLVQVTPLAKKKNVTSGSVKLPTLPETVAESCAPPPSGRLPVSATSPLSLCTDVAIVRVTLPTVNGSQLPVAPL